MWRRIAVIVAVGLSLHAVGCGDQTEPPRNGGADAGTDAGADARSTDGGGATGVPADEVRVLGKGAREAVSTFDFDADANRGTIRFPASNGFAQQIETDDILASRPIDGAAPSGMLQRVVEVERTDDAIVVTSRQATLAESFERADIDMNRRLTGDDVTSSQELRPGVTFETRGQGLAKPFEVNFDTVLFDADGDDETTDDQLQLDGTVAFGAKFEADIAVEDFALQRFLLAVNLEESVDLEVSGDFDETDLERSEKIATTTLNSFTVPVGPVPVVITVELVLRVGANGTMTAEVQASAEQSAEVRLGAEYTKDGGWSGINEPNSSTNVPPPTFGLGTIDARAFAKPQVNVTLYGLAGPYVFAKPFVHFDAEPYRSPFWQMSGGLDMGVGLVVKVPVLGEVASWDKAFPVVEETIDESSNQPPSLTITGPEDGARKTAGSSLELIAEATDREQRDVLVELYRQDEKIDEAVSSEGSEVTFRIRDLCQGTATWRVVAKDDAGATDAGRRTVSVANAPPEVSIRASELTGPDAPDVFPGGYLSATADISDPRCDEAPPPNFDLTEWFIDDRRVASTADLLTRLSPDDYAAGDTIALQAAFDDGEATGRSDEVQVTLASAPSGDLPPEAKISYCSHCKPALITPSGTEPYEPNEIRLRGQGFDRKEGPLNPSQLQWEIQVPGGRQSIGTGESVSFKMDELFSNPGVADDEHTIYLNVEDDAGNTATATAEIEYEAGG